MQDLEILFFRCKFWKRPWSAGILEFLEIVEMIILEFLEMAEMMEERS